MPVDETLRRWLLEQAAAGYTPEQLKASLAQSGQDPRAVDEVLGPSAPLPTPPPAKAAPVPSKKKGVHWTIVLAIVIVGLLLGVLLLFNTIVNNLIRGAIGGAVP